MEEKYISLWDKSAEENDYAGHLETTRDADVIVVGGGFTGLSTAYHGAKLGLDIHVLEPIKLDMGLRSQHRFGKCWIMVTPQDVNKKLELKQAQV